MSEVWPQTFRLARSGRCFAAQKPIDVSECPAWGRQSSARDVMVGIVVDPGGRLKSR